MNTLFATPGYHDPTPSRPRVLRCWMSGCLPYLDLPSTVRSTVCQSSRRSRRRVSRQDWGSGPVRNIIKRLRRKLEDASKCQGKESRKGALKCHLHDGLISPTLLCAIRRTTRYSAKDDRMRILWFYTTGLMMCLPSLWPLYV